MTGRYNGAPSRDAFLPKHAPLFVHGNYRTGSIPVLVAGNIRNDMGKKLKIGLIGTGMICRTAHIPGYQSIPDDCEIVWACDLIEERAKEIAAKNDIPKVTTNYHDILNDPEIDAVSVMTPNAVHLQPAVDALKAGKHVLCEKPLALNGDHARKIARAAKDSDKILQVALQMRFSGQARFVKQYADAGNMGDIYYARAQAMRRRGVPGWGVFIDKEKQGGGPLIDIGVHILDLTLFLMGSPKPVSASARCWDTLGKQESLYNAWGDYDRSKFTVEDMAVGMIRFDQGQVVVLESSFMANIEEEFYLSQLFGTKSGATVKIMGDDPVAIFTEQDQQLFDLRPRNIPDVPSHHTGEIQAFVKAVQEGAPSPVPAEEGLKLNAIFDAMYKSSETGKEEPVDLSY